MRRAVASILQAVLRTDRDISLRPWGRRCLADHHLRTWCPPNKPPRASSGSGESWFDPRRADKHSRGASPKQEIFVVVGTRRFKVSFEAYYGETFRKDLGAVLDVRLPRQHVFGDEVTLQPRSLSVENPVVNAWDRQHRAVFEVALFLTVLVDQVCYTYYRAHHERFASLTQYPKWRGDCPGGCSAHIHPRHILGVVGRTAGHGPQAPGVDTLAVLASAKPVLEREVRSFCEQHMPELNADEFWARCSAEFP